MNKIYIFNLQEIKYIFKSKSIISLKIILCLSLTGCSNISQNINKKNNLIYRSFCDRWLNRRISDNQILSEFIIYDFKSINEIKILCKKYNHLLNDREYCGDWLNKRLTDKEVIRKFGYIDMNKGINEIKVICRDYKYLLER